MMDSSELLIDLERSLHSFEVRSDANKLSQLLSSRFFEFGSSGTTYTRQEILSRLPTEEGGTVIESYGYKSFPLADDVVLITYISKRIKSDCNSAEFLRSSIWRKNHGIWQMEFHQGTPSSI